MAGRDYKQVLGPCERTKRGDVEGKRQRYCEAKNRNRVSAARSREKGKQAKVRLLEELETLRIENQRLQTLVTKFQNLQDKTQMLREGSGAVLTQRTYQPQSPPTPGSFTDTCTLDFDADTFGTTPAVQPEILLDRYSATETCH